MTEKCEPRMGEVGVIRVYGTVFVSDFYSGGCCESEMGEGSTKSNFREKLSRLVCDAMG